jgi:hypothetical protein
VQTRKENFVVLGIGAYETKSLLTNKERYRFNRLCAGYGIQNSGGISFDLCSPAVSREGRGGGTMMPKKYVV